MIPVSFGYFGNIKDNVGTSNTCTFDQFEQWVAHQINRSTCANFWPDVAAHRAAKGKLPYFTVCTFRGTRCQANANDATVLVFDLDSIEESALAALLGKLHGAVRGFAYASPSDGQKPGRCVRIVLALDEALPDLAFDLALKGFAYHMKIPNDDKTERIEHAFFLGRPEGTPERQFWTLPGRALPAMSVAEEGRQLAEQGLITMREAPKHKVPDEVIEGLPDASPEAVARFVEHLQKQSGKPWREDPTQPKNARYTHCVAGARWGLNVPQIEAAMLEHYLPRHHCDTDDHVLRQNANNAVGYVLAEVEALKASGVAWEANIPLMFDATTAGSVVAPSGHVAQSAQLSTLTQPIPRDALVRLAAKLCKSDKLDDMYIGQMLRSALDGHRFAEKGQRDAALLSVTMRLAKAFPQGDPASLAKHFEHSLGLMQDEGSEEDPAEHLIGLLESEQAKVQESARAAKQATVVFQQTQITKAFQGRGYDRAAPYTLEELTAAAQALHCDASELISRWIVQRGDWVYVLFVDPAKGPIYLPPVSRTSIETSVAQNLSPAVTAGVATDTFDERGRAVPKTLAQLVKQYGRVIENSEMSMMAPCTFLDAKRSTIVEATAPLRHLVPEYDLEVDQWLTLLAGDPAPIALASNAAPGTKAARLCDWLATVTDLSACAPALFLKGQASVGKGLFADGLARLWEADRPTSLGEAMGTFNYAVTRCPLILADEQIPENFRGEPRTEELRELITTRVFELTRKHRDPITCKGAVRIILAANNFGIISRRAELTPEDALALADRFILIEPNPLARDFLIKLGGPAWGETVVLGDRLAKHVHWLIAQDALGARSVVRGTRLIVPGDAHELADSLQSASRVPWAICRWLWSFLGTPQTHIAMSAGKPLAALVARADGLPVGFEGVAARADLWMCKERFAECFDHYMQGERVPSREQLAGALRALLVSREDGGRLRRGKGGAIAYYRVRFEVVLQWARQNGEDTAELTEWLMRETEKIGAVGVGPSAGAARAN